MKNLMSEAGGIYFHVHVHFTVEAPCIVTNRGSKMDFWFTLQDKNLNWNLNFAISLNLNSAYIYIFRDLSVSMVAHIIKTQKSKFANIRQVAKLNSMYIFIL